MLTINTALKAFIVIKPSAKTNSSRSLECKRTINYFFFFSKIQRHQLFINGEFEAASFWTNGNISVGHDPQYLSALISFELLLPTVSGAGV